MDDATVNERPIVTVSDASADSGKDEHDENRENGENDAGETMSAMAGNSTATNDAVETIQDWLSLRCRPTDIHLCLVEPIGSLATPSMPAQASKDATAVTPRRLTYSSLKAHKRRAFSSERPAGRG